MLLLSRWIECAHRTKETNWQLCFRTLSLLVLLSIFCLWSGTILGEDWRVGASRIEITPHEPVRLSGYAARIKASEGIDSSLFVRTLYLKHQNGKQLLIVSLDAIGISAAMTEHIGRSIESEFGIGRAEVVICTTHAHTAPHLDGLLTNLFAEPLPESERSACERYTRRLLNETITSVREAVKNSQPGIVSISEDQAEFAINRRVIQSGRWSQFGETPNGPVDRRVRVLSAKDLEGQLIAVTFQYACHCTSISPDRNRISADWAGLAAELLEKQNEGIVALPLIGTGADSNPNPRGEYSHAQLHAKSMAEAVNRALGSEQKPLAAPTQTSFSYIGLEFQRPEIGMLESLVQNSDRHIQNRARGLLHLLKSKDRIPESYPAPVHFWAFENQLAWVFLGGEVVVDYQIRLERELSQYANVWVAAYVDDVFAYVASERLRREGGYEVDSSMIYYNQPGPWVSGTEEKLVKGVLDLQKQTRNLETPLGKEQALQSIEVPSGFRIEQVAAEPLVRDPINIAFGVDGKVWVLEMPDYPNGGERSGRVVCLEDSNRDGVLDSSKPFLSNLPFVSGIYAWRDGVVLACAPEVFFARDTDGDGVADEKRIILSGFSLANPQHRVHGFTYGLDHKLHFGTGADTSTVTLHRLDGTTREFDIRGCDLAIDPDRHELSLESGETQFIRSHDGWGNWFGNDNTHPIYHYVLDRNWSRDQKRHVPGMVRYLTNPIESPVVFPLSPALDRFNDPLTANRYTSVCSTILNLSLGNGELMRGQAIVCEPVHNLVSRLSMVRDGVSWQANRMSDDSRREWIRSTDPWFRPVRVVNSPDGSIWIADMYRRVIEHPTWIPEEWLARLDVYAGQDHGRLYRIFHDSAPADSHQLLSSKSIEELIECLADSNIVVADWAQQILIWKFSSEGFPSSFLERALKSDRSQLRLRAFSILSYVGRLTEIQIIALLEDRDERVATYVLGQLLRQDEWPATYLEAIVRRSTPAEASDDSYAMRAVLALINYDEHTDEAFCRHCSDLLIAHASTNGFEHILEFAKPEKIGLLIKELASRNDDRATIYLNRLIPRIDSKELVGLVEQIAQYDGARPAWHFLMIRQVSSDPGGTVIKNDLVDRVYDDARLTLLSSAPDVDRLAAWELYSSRLTDDSESEISELLEAIARIDQVVAERLITGLFRLGERSRERLLAQSKGWSQSLQSLVLSHFAARPVGIVQLLDEIDRGNLQITDITPSQLEVIRENSGDHLRDRVAATFGKDETTNRSEAIDRFEEEWPAKIDFEQGKFLYATHCAKCHSGNNSGGNVTSPVGPSLQSLSHWTNRAWLEAILDPSRAVDERYRRSSILTKEGLVLSGLKHQETDIDIEFVLTDGRTESIRKSEIEELKSSELSLMPDGFEKLLTPEQIAQIVTYLRRGGDNQ